MLLTKNMVVGESVYGEKRISADVKFTLDFLGLVIDSIVL